MIPALQEEENSLAAVKRSPSPERARQRAEPIKRHRQRLERIEEKNEKKKKHNKGGQAAKQFSECDYFSFPELSKCKNGEISTVYCSGYM